MSNEQAASATETKTNGQAPAETLPNVHAIVQTSDGLIATWSYKTRTECAKALSEHPELKVIAVFKGKKLGLQEKKSFKFC